VTGDGSDRGRSIRWEAIAGDAGGLAVRGDRDGGGSRRPWSPFRRRRLAVWLGTWSAPVCRCLLLIRSVGPAAQKW